MQIGDKVHLVGTVMDIQKGSVLVLTEDAIHQREYWFLEKHVEGYEPAPPLEPGQVPHPGHALPEPPPPAPDQSLPEQEAEAERKREAEAEAEREREAEANRLTPPPTPPSHRPEPPIRRR